MTKIAINGFGRIGRSFFRAAYGLSEFDIVAINDLVDPGTLKYLLKYDSVYGRYEKDIKGVDFFAEKDPAKLPWKKLGIDVVIESSGFFTDAAKAKAHLDAGAKRVVITAPAKGDVVTALIGVNDDRFPKAGPITCNASCTTNSVSPVIKILLDDFGIKMATMTTVHGYTATQKLVDGPDEKDMRRGRAAAVNIVPSTTGAAEAVIETIPELRGKFNAESLRIPTVTGSISVISALLEKKSTVEDINKVFEDAAKNKIWSRILKVTRDPIVSTDIIGEPYGAIVDLSLTKVLDGDFVKVFSWYDNEAGYTATLVEHVRRIIDNL
ncbi:type I glyceraldehyde-3-phosphate dehydrogenase [Candidatus Giovannonibacteria bacterium]|nr:type I glyceraldehyde-3-phosphate dehydrogenase [Candidatus Giovannonibacteria bacterium]